MDKWIKYPTTINLKLGVLDKIRVYMKKHPKGRTINNVMKDLPFSRGTLKTYLTAMACSGELEEVDYNQNTKVFFWRKTQNRSSRKKVKG